MKKTVSKIAALLLTVSLLVTFVVPVSAADISTPFEDSQYYHQGDYSIHYRVIEAEGENLGYILFLHGFLYSGESFAPMAAEMSRAGYTCVLADLPGFGYSTRESAEIEPIDREVLMEGLMDSIAPEEEWILAGQSMGGGVALNIACESDNIKALLLYAPAPIQEMSEPMAGLLTSDLMGGLFSGILKMMVKLTFLVRIMMYMATMDWSYTKEYDLSTLTDPLSVDGTAESMLYMMTRARATDYAVLAALDLPILLVRGDKDFVVSSSMSAQMDAALQSAQKVTIEGAGHMLNETHYEQLSAEAIAFLAAI